MPSKILIVDDNNTNLLLFRDVLRYNGFETIEAENGEVGIQQAQKHQPDLILLDIQMPVMDGYMTLKALRAMAETRSIRIVALTSFAMASDEKRIMAAGFDGFIAKPVSTRELPLVVKRFLEHDKGVANDDS